MALKGSRKAVRPKRTMEQTVAAQLDPALHNASQTAAYELATFRAARKGIAADRNKGVVGPKMGGAAPKASVARNSRTGRNAASPTGAPGASKGRAMRKTKKGD